MGGGMSQTGLLTHPAWQSDKAWAGRFLPQLKRICGEYLIGEAPEEEDAQRNTDLIVLRLEPVRVACRVRRHNVVLNQRYREEFTIRTERPSGIKTELAKIIEGYGDYILYGFADESDRRLCAWTLGALRVFRLWFMSQVIKQKREPGSRQHNPDGSSLFRAFRIDDLPTEFVIARQHYG